MTSSLYGTAELQGDASPSSPKSYRLSKVAKIALALIACLAAAVITYPGTRPTTINFQMERVQSSLGDYTLQGNDSRSSGGAAVAPAKRLQDLEARVAAIEKYLLATGSIEKYLKATGGSGGSGTSRGSVMMPGVLGAMARGHGARRQLRAASSAGAAGPEEEGSANDAPRRPLSSHAARRPRAAHRGGPSPSQAPVYSPLRHRGLPDHS